MERVANTPLQILGAALLSSSLPGPRAGFRIIHHRTPAAHQSAGCFWAISVKNASTTIVAAAKNTHCGAFCSTIQSKIAGVITPPLSPSRKTQRPCRWSLWGRRLAPSHHGRAAPDPGTIKPAPSALTPGRTDRFWHHPPDKWRVERSCKKLELSEETPGGLWRKKTTRTPGVSPAPFPIAETAGELLQHFALSQWSGIMPPCPVSVP